MNEDELQNWACVRAEGRLRLMLRTAAWFAVGGPLAIYIVLIVLLLLLHPTHLDIMLTQRMIAGFAIMIVFSACGGALMGWVLWACVDGDYRKLAAGQRRCPQCGYHLKGVDGSRCPECGHENTDAHDAPELRDVEHSQE